MIDSSKKQPQSFPEILPFEDIESLKGKECLDPDIPKCLKEVLQLKLQQRRTREQLVDQGIMPPLKSPAVFHEQIKSLERARTENFLKHKIRSRPDRSELVRMHILEETFAEPSLQATQMKLKRARLADDLNEKIAQRPGPMELVEKNILPVDSSVKEAIIAVGQENYPQAVEDFSFDEDSSDALSPDQPGSQESQGSTASPGEPKMKETPSPVTPASSATQYPPIAIPGPDFLKPPVTDQHVARTTAAPLTTNSVTATKHCSGPTLIKQPHPKNPSDRPRSKKCKEPKPRVKKLKYHQYIPPDQKGEQNQPPMDTNYARLLQQQQLFLQLQILSQQQQHYNYQAILPAPLKPVNDKQGNTGNVPLNTLNNSTSSAAVNTPRQNTNILNRKPGPLPPSLDDLKVAELKMELKLRGLPVSGTKIDLIERLKPYQDLNNNSVGTSNTVAAAAPTNGTSKPAEATTPFPAAPLNKQAMISAPSSSSETTPVATGHKMGPLEHVGSPLPISPSPSEQSSLGADDANMADTLTEIITMMSPSQFPSASPLRAAPNEDGGHTSGMDLDVTEKDRKLQEKEKQIEELKRKLEQEQKLVEVLKMQLEVEKRSHPPPPPPPAQASAKTPMPSNRQPNNNNSVKEEGTLADSATARPLASDTSHVLGRPRPADLQNLVAKKAVVVKQEIPVAKAEPQKVLSQFYVSSQRPPQTALVAHPQALLTAQGTAQLLLPLSLQGPNSATSVQLPVSNIQVQTQAGLPAITQVSTSGLAPKVPQMHMSAPKQNVSPQHAAGQTSENRKVFAPTSPNAVFSYQNPSATNLQQPLFKQASNTTPPRSGNQATLVQNGPNPLQKPPSPAPSQQYLLQPSLFSSSGTKTKDPPRYEEAIKQTRSLQSSQREISNAHSQHMDDLFDILIKSGEISMPMKEEPALISKMRPVTANITTMPVNTVVSRPPPQVQMAPPLSLEPTSTFSLALENQLEALLEGTLPSGNGMPHLTGGNEDKESFSVIEDLQNDLLNHTGLLDHSHSPMETSDSQFTPSSCLSLDLPDPNLDNMEWLDLTMPTASSGLTPLSSTAPSMFSTDFLDPQDLQLHWD
ncbi:myocardin-related transcription factor B [Vipera latastei]